MVAICDLAYDLRDALVEYQVGIHSEKCTRDSQLMPSIVLATECNLQAKLQADCESHDPRFGKRLGR
jgi:hypothetical protein